MDSPGRGACTGDPKLVFGGHQGLENVYFRGSRGWENLKIEILISYCRVSYCQVGGVYLSVAFSP